MAHPGHQTRIVARILSGLTLILLTTLSFYTALPVHAPQPPAYPQATTTTSSTGTRADLGSGLPQGVGASSLPDLSLPKTVASDVDNLNAAGGVIQSSSQNLTLYNAAVRLRLLGGLTPHEQLLGPDDTILSYWSFWGVEANMSGSFAPLVPVSNNFMIVGANATGTFVIRTMQLSTGTYFGTLKIVYDATSAGPLKWDLQFTAGVPGQYRLAYGWWNITNTFPLVSGSKQFVAQYGVSNYTLSWDDVSGLFSTTVSLAPNMFSLFIDLGPVAAGSSVLIDPSLVSSNIVNVLQNPTAPSFQRKVIYEPKGGYYFAFIGNYTGSGYSYSHDGINWSPLQPMPPGWPWRFPSSQLAVLSAGQSVTVATGNSNSTSWGGGITVPLYLVSGTISGPKISWGSVSRPENFSYQCPYKCTVYTQFASITYASSGQIASSVDLQILDQSSTTNPSCVSRLYAQYGGRLIVVDQTTNCVSSSFGDNRPDDIMSEIVPSDSQGRVRLVYQIYAPSGIGMARTLRSLWMDGTTNGTIDRLDTSVKYSDGFSVTTGNNYSIHIVYLGTDGNVTDASRKVSDSAWSFSKNIFSGTANSASVTSDWSTNDIFALAMMGSSIGMKEKTAGQGWSSILFPVTRRVNASELVSNFLSASATNSSTISLLWSEGFGARYNVMFASIPIQTVWSPYSSPSDPWDGNGLAPYGQYFANLGEYVSPSTGMLTVRQTDLLLPGRGLDLEITRLYAEPYSFLGGNVYNYENYTWAPMGVGWQFSFPWMNPSTPTPAYIHLWDGEGYRLPSSFWTGSSATFENHQGEHFRLVRNSTGIELFTKSGTSFSFDPASHALKRISDPLGNNITFSYNTSQQISKIVDTVGRVFLFCYAAGFLLSIEQNSGSCGTDFARRIIYWIDFSIPDLLYVLDPAGRRTLYTYGSALPSSAQYWLITKLTYPTGWYSNYTYMPSLMGTQGYSYRVVKQYVTSGSAPVREFLYNYTNGPGDQVSNSTVTTIDGGSGTLQTISYTAYSFSFAGVSWNVSDANHNFVRGVQQRFGVHGEVPMEIVLVSPTQGYTNYYRYDLWGNQIYSRRVINSSANWYHESFNAYYNDGISPGFYSFQETFRQGNYTATDNYWQVHNGTWLVKNRAYNGTSPVFNPARQEGFFAYTNFTSPSVSIIAMVYITKRTATSDQRVGLLAHYPGSGLRKWALVLHNSTSGMKLSLLDESTANGWRVENPCTLNYNSWYRFNFTLSGSQAWGSANAQGVSCSVSGSFISTDITTATGFGLYAGGYSALFSNVTLTTIAAGITGTVFSNSFIQNGGPNSNVQGALAGTAELQNGTRSAPAETYYSYLPWGGLSQTKQLYNSTSGKQWLTSSRTYDIYGNLVKIIDPRGALTSYAYSAKYQAAYLTSQNQTVLGSVAAVSSFGYDFTMGTRVWAQQPAGYGSSSYNTTYSYDILARLTKITYLTGDYASFTYNDPSNYVNVTNENGWKTQQIYDGLGRLSMVVKFSGGLPYSNESYSYNWLGEVTSRTDPLGNRYSYQYDALGRATAVTKPDGNRVAESYNDASSIVTLTDENGVAKYLVYDRLGRLIQAGEVQPGCCLLTSYSYDEVGNLRKLMTSTGQSTSYQYDNLNRLTKTGYPDVTSESYAYDNNGNVVLKTDRKNTSTTYTYDSLNRLTNKTYYGSIVAKEGYVYDRNGNLQSLSSQNATLTYNYDARNRLIYEDYNVNSGQLDYSFSYTFNGEALSSVWHPLGFTLSYSYDDLGRVKSVSQSGSSPYASFTYYKNDGIRGIAYGNGLVANYTYTTLGHALRITLNDTSVSPVKSLMMLNYAYNKTGTVTSVTGQSTTTTGASLALSEKYNYDNLQRLKYANVTGGTTKNVVTYGYDSLGNRAFQTLNGTSTSYTYNTPNNELKSSTTTNGPSLAYSYDPDGNLLTQNVTTGGSTVHWTYAWDVPGNLLKASKENAVQGSYAYDGLGRRVMSREGTTTGYYAYSGTETRYEYFNPGGTNYYVYAGGERIARVTSYGAVNYYHADALGSTRLVTSSTKSVLFSDNYQPFGQDNLASGSETYRFTGASYSSATGLYYEVLRWYDSSVGRFISLDPLSGYSSDSQSLNGYVYVRNTPTTLVDPTGAVWCDEDPIACEGGLSPYNSLSNADREDPRWIRVCSQNPPFCGGWTPEENDLSSLNVGGRYTEDAGWSGDTPASGDVASAGDATPHPPAITATASDTLSTLDTNPTDISSDTSASIEVKYISRAGFDEAQSEGAFGNQPTSLAQGNYAHNVLGSGQAPRALGPGSFPDQWDTNGFTEIKPYHEGIEPLQEFSSQLGQYRQAFQERFGYAPSVRLILYRYV